MILYIVHWIFLHKVHQQAMSTIVPRQVSLSLSFALSSFMFLHTQGERRVLARRRQDLSMWKIDASLSLSLFTSPGRYNRSQNTRYQETLLQNDDHLWKICAMVRKQYIVSYICYWLHHTMTTLIVALFVLCLIDSFFSVWIFPTQVIVSCKSVSQTFSISCSSSVPTRRERNVVEESGRRQDDSVKTCFMMQKEEERYGEQTDTFVSDGVVPVEICTMVRIYIARYKCIGSIRFRPLPYQYAN
jgi:hypothetical protein